MLNAPHALDDVDCVCRSTTCSYSEIPSVFFHIVHLVHFVHSVQELISQTHIDLHRFGVRLRNGVGVNMNGTRRNIHGHQTLRRIAEGV